MEPTLGYILFPGLNVRGRFLLLRTWYTAEFYNKYGVIKALANQRMRF